MNSRFRSRKFFLVFFLITIFVLMGLFLNTDETRANDVRTLVVTFSGTPSSVNITKAPLKYNKKFAFSMNADDGFKDSYTIFYKALNGGRIASSDTFSKGYYYTDGAGNKIPFKGNLQLTTMKINSNGTFSAIRNIGNPSYVDWGEASVVSNRGWDITNHGWSHNGYPDPVDKIFSYPDPHGPSTIDYDYEIEANQDEIETNVGRRPIIMGPPDADPGYIPYTFTNHGLFAKVAKISAINRYTVPGTDIGQDVNLDQYEIMGYVFNNTEDGADDLINYVDLLNSSSTGSSHYWSRITLHRFYETDGQNGLGYPSLKQFLDYVDDTYGVNGNDTIWFTSSQEIYEYLYSRQNLSLSQDLSGDTLTITLDFGSYPSELRREGISLLVDSDATIASVTSPDDGDTITFNSQTGLINADWGFVNNDAFEADCEAKVATAEASRTQTDYDEASDYVSALDEGAFKTSLITRLNDIEIFAREWFISFGTSTTSSRGKIWNGVNASNVQNKTLNEASGVASVLRYDTVNAFGGIGSNGVIPNPPDSGKYADNITRAYAYPLSSPPTPIIFKISNLDATKLYDVELFASKTSAGSSTYYVIGDTTTNTQTLDTYNNTQNTVTFYKVKPSATDDIQVNVAVGSRMGVFHLTERPNIQEPVASIPSGLYNATQYVTLSSTGSDFIRYSTVEIPATCSAGTLYSGPITISSTQDLYIKACDNSDNFSTATYNYVIDTTPPSTPVASPGSGTYNSTQSVSLTSSGSDYIKYSKADMPISCFYGNLYSGPVTIDSSETLYAIGCDNADNFSSASFIYVIDSEAPSTPVASPTAGTYNTTQSIELTSEGSDYIKYSTSEIPGTCSAGTLYSSPISVSSSETIYVRACDNAGNSSTASFAYVIDETQILSTPQASPGAGTYNSTQTITLSSGGSNYIRYSISGMPETCSDGTLYSSPILVSSSQTIYVRACNEAGDNSSTASFAYIIQVNSTTTGTSGIAIAKFLYQQSLNSVQTPTITTSPDISTQPPTLTVKKVLKQGATGKDVKSIQIYLNTHGFPVSSSGVGSLGKETNYFGAKTKHAVLLFQKANKLIADGIVGSMTLKKMK